MYTKGIRKIYCNHHAGLRLSIAETMAFHAGYQAMAFNGVIYIRVDNEDFSGWINTCFHITDFSDIEEEGQ